MLMKGVLLIEESGFFVGDTFLQSFPLIIFKIPQKKEDCDL